MSTVTVPKRRGRPPKAKPAPPVQEEIIQNVVSGPKSSKQKRKVPVLKGPSRSKKIANPPKKIKETPTPKVHMIFQPPFIPKGELEGETRKQWVKFMKEVKGWAKEQKLTDKEYKSFAEYYYKAIANSTNPEKTLNQFMKGFKEMYPFESQVIPDIPIDPVHRDDPVDDVIGVVQPLSEPQTIHIKGVMKMLEKDPKLRADIKRTITEELTKGSINPDQFDKYNQEIERVQIEKEVPEAIRGTRKTAKPRAKKSAQVETSNIPMDIDITSQLPKGKSKKDTQKKKDKIVVL